MSRKNQSERSAIVAATGMMAAVWLALLSAVREKGGSDESFYRLNTPEGKPLIERMAEIIIGAVVMPVVQVAWKLVFTWILAVCRFTSYVNPDITAENFPLQSGDLMVKEVFDIAIPRNMSTPEVLAYLDQEGYRATTFVELLFWWLTNPTKQTDCLVVALGSVWGGHAPCVNGRGSYRGLDLSSLAIGWDSRSFYRFAAVRK